MKINIKARFKDSEQITNENSTCLFDYENDAQLAEYICIVAAIIEETGRKYNISNSRLN